MIKWNGFDTDLQQWPKLRRMDKNLSLYSGEWKSLSMSILEVGMTSLKFKLQRDPAFKKVHFKKTRH